MIRVFLIEKVKVFKGLVEDRRDGGFFFGGIGVDVLIGCDIVLWVGFGLSDDY